MKTYNNCSLTSQEALDDALIERQKTVKKLEEQLRYAKGELNTYKEWEQKTRNKL